MILPTVVGVDEQGLLLLRLVAVPREVAANTAVEAPPNRRLLRFLPSLPLGLCEHELAVASFAAGLTAPPGTLIKC
jgi:hypothetical protein